MARKTSSLSQLAKERKKPESQPQKKIHLNSKMDEELKHAMKVYCAEQGITIKDFLTESIQKALHEARTRTEKRKP